MTASPSPRAAATATASRPTFTELVRAEPLPEHLHWTLRDTLTVLLIPALFLGVMLAARLGLGPNGLAVTDTSLRLVFFVFLVVANARLLARHWRALLRAPWRSAALIIAGMIVIQVVLTLLGAVLRPLAGITPGGGAEDAAAGTGAGQVAFGVLLFASLGPTVTALIEDFVFRHTLLLTFPVWNRWWSAAGLVVVNALVFGAIHVNNFDGHLLLTLSYAGAGLIMNLVYLWTRNIWHVLLMHGLNNFILGGPIVLLLVHALGADVM